MIFHLFDKCPFRWGSYLYFNAEIVNNGDKIKLRDALGNFLKSPAVQVIQLNNSLSHLLLKHFFQEFGRTLKLLWQQMLTNGFWSTWSQLVQSPSFLFESSLSFRWTALTRLGRRTLCGSWVLLREPLRRRSGPNIESCQR